MFILEKHALTNYSPKSLSCNIFLYFPFKYFLFSLSLLVDKPFVYFYLKNDRFSVIVNFKCITVYEVKIKLLAVSDFINLSSSIKYSCFVNEKFFIFT